MFTGIEQEVPTIYFQKRNRELELFKRLINEVLDANFETYTIADFERLTVDKIKLVLSHYIRKDFEIEAVPCTDPTKMDTYLINFVLNGVQKSIRIEFQEWN